MSFFCLYKSLSPVWVRIEAEFKETLISPLPDRIEVFVPSNENLPLAHRGAAGDQFLQVILCNHFKVWARFNDAGDAAIGHEVSQSTGSDG